MSTSFHSIANVGVIVQPDLLLLFSLVDTENDASPSENPVTQLGSSLVSLVMVL